MAPSDSLPTKVVTTVTHLLFRFAPNSSRNDPQGLSCTGFERGITKIKVPVSEGRPWAEKASYLKQTERKYEGNVIAVFWNSETMIAIIVRDWCFFFFSMHCPIWNHGPELSHQMTGNLDLSLSISEYSKSSQIKSRSWIRSFGDTTSQNCTQNNHQFAILTARIAHTNVLWSLRSRIS